MAAQNITMFLLDGGECINPKVPSQRHLKKLLPSLVGDDRKSFVGPTVCEASSTRLATNGANHTRMLQKVVCAQGIQRTNECHSSVVWTAEQMFLVCARFCCTAVWTEFLHAYLR